MSTYNFLNFGVSFRDFYFYKTAASPGGLWWVRFQKNRENAWEFAFCGFAVLSMTTWWKKVGRIAFYYASTLVILALLGWQHASLIFVRFALSHSKIQMDVG
jgi:hypothetical protein